MVENVSHLLSRLEKEEEIKIEEHCSTHGNGGEEPPPSASTNESSSSSHRHNYRNSRDESKKPFFKLDVKLDLPMFNGVSNA